MAVGLRETVLAPRFSRVLCVLVLGSCAAVGASLVVWGRVEPLVRSLPALLLVAVLSVALFWRPRIGIGPERVEVVNPFRTHTVAWTAVLDVETRWTLTLVTERGRIPVWAAPSPGPFGELAAHDRDARGQLTRGGRGSMPSAVGDLAAVLVLRQWRDHRDGDPIVTGGPAEARSRTDLPWIVACALLAALAIVGAVWP